MKTLIIVFCFLSLCTQNTSPTFAETWWAGMTQKQRNEAMVRASERNWWHAKQTGKSKNFVKKVLMEASDGEVSLPNYTINYDNLFQSRNEQQSICCAEAGNILQLFGTVTHTAVIIENYHNGTFEVIGEHWKDSKKIAKYTIDTNEEKISFVSYEVGEVTEEK